MFAWIIFLIRWSESLLINLTGILDFGCFVVAEIASVKARDKNPVTLKS